MIDQTSVLDHGYIKFIESWGSDERIIESARMSTNKGFQGWETDAKLLAYLYRNNHATPFEMAGMIIEVKAPIFVFREWHRHRTQSYNEMSARYVPIPDEHYVPTIDRILIDNVPTGNRQASSTGAVVTRTNAVDWLAQIVSLNEQLQRVYTNALEVGIPKELARLVIPVSRYSKMRASANLRNWLAFLTLRLDSKAQWEIREYARVVGSMIAEKFPRTWELFCEKRDK